VYYKPKVIAQIAEERTDVEGDSKEIDFWDSLLFLLGYLGLSADEFWDFQYNELAMRYHAYRDKRDAQIKHDYNITRWQSWMLLQPHIDSKKGGMKSPIDLVRFDWDEEAKVIPLKSELTEEQKKIIENMDNAVFTGGDQFDSLVDIGKRQEKGL
jgi:hypothetical protein